MQLYEYESPPSVYPGGYSFFYANQTSTSSSYVDNNKCLGFDLNRSPQAENENEDE